MWWGIATLTTVGYGDMYPITGLGKFLGGMIAVIGVGLFALPAGLLASGFSEELSKRNKRNTQICPHCGKEIGNSKD
jgi:voltage-gated potassium channel